MKAFRCQVLVYIYCTFSFQRKDAVDSAYTKMAIDKTLNSIISVSFVL